MHVVSIVSVTMVENSYFLVSGELGFEPLHMMEWLNRI